MLQFQEGSTIRPTLEANEQRERERYLNLAENQEYLTMING